MLILKAIFSTAIFALSFYLLNRLAFKRKSALRDTIGTSAIFFALTILLSIY